MSSSKVTIHTAAYEGKLDDVRPIVEGNPEAVNTMDEDGRTALHWAVSGKQLPVVQYLLNHSANPTVTDATDITPLHIASSINATDIFSLLLPLSATVINAQTSTGQTALHYAASKNHAEIVDMLLRSGADPNLKDQLGQTPMHRAVTRGWSGIVSTLKAGGGKINVRDAVGNTPLHLAAEEAHVDIIRYLLDNGADPNLTNKEGQQPGDVAGDRHVKALFEAL